MQRVLNFEKRAVGSRSFLRKLRSQGRIPAVVYGQTENFSVSIDAHEFSKNFPDFTLNTSLILRSGKEEHCVFIQDLDENLLNEKIEHIDFFQVHKDEKIIRRVHIEIHGTSVGVREGGKFHVGISEISIQALPLDIPGKLLVDVSALKRSEKLKVGDLPLEKTWTLLAEEKEQIVAWVD